MPAKNSPFVEAKYGWGYGEDGWDVGMDENLIKFSYLFDKNIDGIVSSLPAVVNGKAYFLNTDNRIYFAVSNTWYSTPAPKWITLTLRTTGEYFQFNGTSLTQVLSNASAGTQLNAIQATLSGLGSASTKDESYFATSAQVALKANTASPTFTGTVSGISKSMVGLGNVDNTSDVNKPISTATQNALNAITQTISGSGVVRMVRTGTNTWTVYKPDGTVLSTSGSTTSGLQEAINYAASNSTGLHVVGGGTASGGDPSVINCTTSVIFPPMQGKTIDFDWCTVNFTSAVTGAGMIFDSCMMVTLNFKGQIVYQGNDAALVFKPSNPVPLDNVTTIIDSKFYVHTIACIGGTNPVGVNMDPALGAIKENVFEFIEINGANNLTVYGLHGIRIITSSPGFLANTIKCQHLHKFKAVGLQVGTAATPTSMYANTFEVNIMPAPVSGFTATGIQVYAQDNFFLAAILNDEGTPAEGIKIESSGLRNKFIVKRNNSTTPVNNLGGSTNIFL